MTFQELINASKSPLSGGSSSVIGQAPNSNVINPLANPNQFANAIGLNNSNNLDSAINSNAPIDYSKVNPNALNNISAGINPNASLNPTPVTAPSLIKPNVITSKTATTKANTIAKGLDLITPKSTNPVAETVSLINKNNGQTVQVSKADWDTNASYKDVNSPWKLTGTENNQTSLITQTPTASTTTSTVTTPQTYSADANDSYIYNTSSPEVKSAVDAYNKQYGTNLSGDNLSNFINKTQSDLDLNKATDAAQTAETAQEGTIKTTYQKYLDQEKQRQDEANAMSTTGLASAGVYAPMLQGYQSEQSKRGADVLKSIEVERDTLIEQAKAALATKNIDLADKYFQQAQEKQQQAYSTRLQNEQLKQSEITSSAAKVTADRNARYMTVGNSLLDTTTGKFLTDPTSTSTTEQKNYQYYAQQEQVAGREAKDFNTWNLEQKAPSTVKEYDAAVAGGFQGTQLDYIKQKKAATGTYSTDDVTAISEGIMNGSLPAKTAGLYRMAAPVLAELAKKGFDFRTAALDQTAMEKYMAGLNSTAQLRLRQASNFAAESLGLVDDLNIKTEDALHRAGITEVAKVQKKLAIQGVYGPEVKGLFTQLDNQISDLTSELATVYKGGNGATDESLQLAAKQLQADWDYGTLKSNVELVRKNLAIRKSSILNTGAITSTGETFAGGNTPTNTNSENGDDGQFDW